MPVNSEPHIQNQVVCANVFVRRDDKILMLRRSPEKKYAPNYLHPVGGKLEKDENPYMCAKREVLEEAGIKIKNIHLEAVFLEIQPEKYEPYNWVIYHFSADYKSGEVKQTEEGELIWLTEQELQKDQLFPSVKPVIHHILDKNKGTIFTTVEYADDHKIINYITDFCA